MIAASCAFALNWGIKIYIYVQRKKLNDLMVHIYWYYFSRITIWVGGFSNFLVFASIYSMEIIIMKLITPPIWEREKERERWFGTHEDDFSIISLFYFLLISFFFWGARWTYLSSIFSFFFSQFEFLTLVNVSDRHMEDSYVTYNKTWIDIKL